MESALPIEDLCSEINSAVFAYGRTNLGETIFNGIDKDDVQKNTRSGAALADRLNQKHSLKVAYSTGVTTRYGSDYSTFIVAYQYLWFDK